MGFSNKRSEDIGCNQSLVRNLYSLIYIVYHVKLLLGTTYINIVHVFSSSFSFFFAGVVGTFMCAKPKPELATSSALESLAFLSR